MKRATWMMMALALLLGGVGQARADPITTLFNTGVDASGTPLADSTVGDPHYSLVSFPGGTATLLVRTSAGGYPIPPYIGDDSLSAWIGPNNDHSLDGAAGSYDYQTTFSLAGFDPTTASITGGWSSDNEGVKILLNGVDIGSPSTSSTQFSSGFAPFTITGGFVSGVNTLDFIVENDGNSSNPTALRVEMTGTASASAAPTPSSLAMLGMATASFAGYFGWRRKRQPVPA